MQWNGSRTNSLTIIKKCVVVLIVVVVVIIGVELEEDFDLCCNRQHALISVI